MIDIAVNQKENQKLSELRDWLLPMLMNGHVTVGEKMSESGLPAGKAGYTRLKDGQDLSVAAEEGGGYGGRKKQRK